MPDYDYDRDVGGIAYLYLRGMKAPSSYEGKRYRGYGVFANRITSEYIEKLDALFS
jgi:exodeoxyribonuclease V beta subunit